MGLYDWDQLRTEEITELYLRKVAVGQNIVVARIEVKAGAVTQPHRHENEEVIIVLRGTWLFHLPTGDVTLTENQVLCIPPGTEHSSEAFEDVVALDICAGLRVDWLTGADRPLHNDPNQYLWAV